jgi:putative FmdB family regulatory protein
MPIYEYECGGCGERREFIQKFSDPQKRKCPACGALKLKRLVSAAAFHLKGSGWYVTDFRDKDKKKGDGKGDAKADGKAAAKADAAKSKDSGTKSSDATKSKKTGDSKSAG